MKHIARIQKEFIKLSQEKELSEETKQKIEEFFLNKIKNVLEDLEVLRVSIGVPDEDYEKTLDYLYIVAAKHVKNHDKIDNNKNSNKRGFIVNIEEDTVNNDNFRKVLYTGENSQLVLMSLKPGEEIGNEIHNVDQFFRVDAGSGQVFINGIGHAFSDGFAFIVPAGAEHNVINNGIEDVKLYSIYSPAHHKDGIIHLTKEIAEKSDEHFDGKTTE